MHKNSTKVFKRKSSVAKHDFQLFLGLLGDRSDGHTNGCQCLPVPHAGLWGTHGPSASQYRETLAGTQTLTGGHKRKEGLEVSR